MPWSPAPLGHDQHLLVIFWSKGSVVFIDKWCLWLRTCDPPGWHNWSHFSVLSTASARPMTRHYFYSMCNILATSSSASTWNYASGILTLMTQDVTHTAFINSPPYSQHRNKKEQPTCSNTLTGLLQTWATGCYWQPYTHIQYQTTPLLATKSHYRPV